MIVACARSALLAGVILLAGCYSLTNFQSPEVLPAGHVAVGAGLASAFSTRYSEYPSLQCEGDILVRCGLGSNIDVGAKVSGPFGSLAADAKWQIVSSPLLLAFDVGGSYGRFEPGPQYDYFTVYPQLLFGSRRIYGALRMLDVYEVKHDPWDGSTNTYQRWFPTLYFGGSFGDQFRVVPELSLSFLSLGERPEPFYGIGVSFQYRLGSDEDDYEDEGTWYEDRHKK